MKKRIALLVFITAFLLGAGLASAQPQPQPPPPQKDERQGPPPQPPDPLGDVMFPPDMVMQHQRELALTDDQDALDVELGHADGGGQQGGDGPAPGDDVER